MKSLLGQFTYQLPEALIAQLPTRYRDRSRLMVVDRKSERLADYRFDDLLTLLRPNDLLVLNNTKVFAARLIGKKMTGGKVELLLTHKRDGHGYFEAMIGGSVKPGQSVAFAHNLKATIVKRDASSGLVWVSFSISKGTVQAGLKAVGLTPLPPYIHSPLSEKQRANRYQTVYATTQGSCAAPTAGLHFSKRLLTNLQKRRVQVAYITLHVGLGTFLPVSSVNLLERRLHEESFYIKGTQAKIINEALTAGKNIVAVGTTTTRCLESAVEIVQGKIRVCGGQGKTRLFIQPGFKFKIVSKLITNFHLPQSSLLMLVSALVSAPNSETQFTTFEHCLVGKAYRRAVKKSYRFYSFGDAMLIQ